MTIFVQEEKISEIKNAADILEIVSETVRLKKTGQNYMGLCPFHSEKTPSFSVNPQRSIYHCFGCGAGGDAISFLMRRDGVTFPDAIRTLARRYGIDLPEKQMGEKELQAAREREEIFRANRSALEFYQHILFKSEKGDPARAYLKARGIDGSMAREYGLGFVPEGWDNLSSRLADANIREAAAEQSGLIVRKNKDHFYDRFRNRVIFPIINISGQITGFGGRVLDDSLPKYLNSPETPVYNKSRQLYGYNMSKTACRESETVHVVEGYFDFITLFSNGIENTVATLGTAITGDHIRLLSRNGVKRFVLVFDSDAAGIKAAERSIPVFNNEFINAEILVLPEGHDPDSYVRQFGADAFRKAGDSALDVVSFLTETAISKYGLSVSGRLSVINSLTETIVNVQDPVARSLYIRDIASRTGIDEKAVHEKISEDIEKKRGRTEVYSLRQNETSVPEKVRAESGRWRGMEDKILSMMLQFPAVMEECRIRRIDNYFDDETLIPVVRLVMAYTGEEDGLVAYLMNNLQTAGQQELVAALAIGDIPWVYENCLMLIQQFIRSKSRHRDSLSDRIRIAEEKGDHALLIQLIQEKKQFSEQLKEKRTQGRKRYY